GSFRPPADTPRVVWARPAGLAAQLRRPNRALGGRSGRARDKSVLRSLPGGAATPAGRAGDGRDRYREPVDHHRRLLDDAPSDTTWPLAAHICFANFR